MLDSEPKNIRAAEQVGVLRRRLGNAARDAKRYPEAIAHHREAVRPFEMVVNRLGPLPNAMGEQAFARVDFADTLLDAAGASRVPVADFRTRHEAIMARLAKRKLPALVHCSVLCRLIR